MREGGRERGRIIREKETNGQRPGHYRVSPLVPYTTTATRRSHKMPLVRQSGSGKSPASDTVYTAISSLPPAALFNRSALRLRALKMTAFGAHYDDDRVCGSDDWLYSSNSTLKESSFSAIIPFPDSLFTGSWAYWTLIILIITVSDIWLRW